MCLNFCKPVGLVQYINRSKHPLKDEPVPSLLMSFDHVQVSVSKSNLAQPFRLFQQTERLCDMLIFEI